MDRSQYYNSERLDATQLNATPLNEWFPFFGKKKDRSDSSGKVKLKKADLHFIADWEEDLHLVYVSLALEDQLSADEKKVVRQITKNMHRAALRNKRYEDRTVDNIVNAVLVFLVYDKAPGFDEFKGINPRRFERWMGQDNRIDKYVY